MANIGGGMIPAAYAPEYADIERKRQLANALRSQAFQQQQPQFVAGHYVGAPTWATGLEKGMQLFAGMKGQREADQQMADLNQRRQTALADTLRNYQSAMTGAPAQAAQPQQPALPPGPPMAQDAPNVGMLSGVQQGGGLPDLGINNLWASGLGSPPQGMQKNPLTPSAQGVSPPVPSDVKQEARGPDMQAAINALLSNPDTQQMAMQLLASMPEREARHQERQEERAWRGDQARIAAQERADAARQSAADRVALARLAASNRAPQAPIAIIGADGKPMYVPPSMAYGKQPFNAASEAKQAAFEQQKAQNEISSQQVLDQAAALFGHKGRQMGTGTSSWVGQIPIIANDAKDFQKQLETFKAQTFIPMVSALKGMGALSDAEGKKLSASVGALEPGMTEKEFEDSLKNVTRTLYQKGKAAGLNISLPDFATSEGIQPSAPQMPSMDAINAEFAKRGLK